MIAKFVCFLHFHVQTVCLLRFYSKIKQQISVTFSTDEVDGLTSLTIDIYHGNFLSQNKNLHAEVTKTYADETAGNC